MRYTMESAAKGILLTILVFGTIIILTMIAGHFANGQETTATEPQVTTAEPAVAVDPSTIIAGTGVIGAATAIVNSVRNNKKQDKNVKGTDMDLYKYIKINNRIWATWSQHKDKTIDQILDMPMTTDPQDLDQTTFRDGLAREETEWKEYIDSVYLYKK